MSIVSSTHTVGPEDQGQTRITESHTDSTGKVHTHWYMVPTGTDVSARLTARAAALNVMLAEEEARQSIEAD